MIKLLLLAAVALGAAIAGAQTIDDETAIRTIVQDEASAWTHGDATAYSLHFADDGAFTNILGEFSIGHDVFLKHHEFLFQGPYRGTTLHHDIVSLKFPRPDVAVVGSLDLGHGFSETRARVGDGCKRASPHTPVAGTRQGHLELVVVNQGREFRTVVSSLYQGGNAVPANIGSTGTRVDNADGDAPTAAR